MTVNDASLLLYEWFSRQDSFSLKSDYRKLILLSEEPEAHKAAVICALKQFEAMEIIKSATVEGNVELNGAGKEEIWVLVKKYSSMDQTISISPQTAIGIHAVATAYYDTLGLSSEECDVLSIQEGDIASVVSAFNTLAQKK
tara:strand:- start:2 stop:427 length:426 start_codon:yes stop_codon:yes gene_type:complete